MKHLITIVIIMMTSSLFGQTTTIQVGGACGMCKDRIENIAANTIGINSVNFDLETGLLSIDYVDGFFQISELHQNLANAGHDTDKVKSSQETYFNLPACCQYRADADGNLTGTVTERIDGNMTPLIGATVTWLNTGIGTATGIDGEFILEMSDKTDQLVVSYVGYENDTLAIESSGLVNIILDNSVMLNTIEVVYKSRATEVSLINPLKVERINRKELTKAACCNLSESFDTNPSVDVSFTDAVTGTRQIEMLGLAGPYVQITKEGMPDIRGLSALDGFTFIPGPWVDGIQLNFGTGSVINGFESVAGQINVELKKPNDIEKLHLNAFGNLNGRYEANLVTNFKVSPKYSTSIMLHGATRRNENDRNSDGFLDNPLTNTISLMNRWKYESGDGHVAQFGVKSTFNNREGGTYNNTLNPWTANSNVDRHEVWMKRGVVFKDNPNSSIGMVLSGTYHDLESNYGSRIYNGKQKMLYANLIYSTIFEGSENKLTTGLSFQGEHYNETFSDLNFTREEYVPGIFGEYAISEDEKYDIVLGLRADYNNYYGLFATPRLHARYAFNENNVARVVAGRGQRTANIFAENIRGMASNRKWIIESEDNDNPFGLDPEIAWNTGLNYTYLWDNDDRINTLSFDYYYTFFQNQVVVDYDQEPRELHIYNLDGSSYAHSFKTQLDLSPVDRLSLRVAYRYNLVNVDQQLGKVWKPLAAKHRAFANVAYETKDEWKFDYTINWIGQKRIPNTTLSPTEFQLDDESPSFWMHNVQVSKVYKKFEFYAGAENLLDFRQEDPILSSNDPSGEYFDASMVWGPIFGRNVYLGFRYILNHED